MCIMSEIDHLFTVSSVESIRDYDEFYLLLMRHNIRFVQTSVDDVKALADVFLYRQSYSNLFDITNPKTSKLG